MAFLRGRARLCGPWLRLKLTGGGGGGGGGAIIIGGGTNAPLPPHDMMIALYARWGCRQGYRMVIVILNVSSESG